MINPSSHKTSFDIRIPHDPSSKCIKFITKGHCYEKSVSNSFMIDSI